MSAPTTMEWLHTAAVRVGVGSGRLTAHLARRTVAVGQGRYQAGKGWVEGSSGIDKLLRLGLLAAAVLIVRKIATALGRWAYHRIESGAWGPFLFVAAGVWIVAAYRVGRPGWEPKQRQPEQAPETTEAPPEGGEEQPEQASAVSLVKPPLPTFHQLCESLARVGTPHAHVAALAEDLGTTAELVREALDRCGVAVEPVRMRGRGSSTGVKGDALPTPRPVPDGVVAAGGAANNDNNNADTATAEEGLRVKPIGLSGSVVYDPSEMVRHHQVRGQ